MAAFGDLLIAASPGWTRSQNLPVPGYLGVGSSSAPGNTTAGDLTAVRAFLPTVSTSNTILTVGTATAGTNGIALITGTLASNSAGPTGLTVSPTFSGSADSPEAFLAQGTFTPSGNITNAYGFLGLALGNPAAGKTITNVIGLYARADAQSGGGAITNVYNAWLDTPNIGSIIPTNAVNMYLGLPTAGTNKYYFQFSTNNAAALGAYQGKLPIVVGGVGGGFIPWYL